MNRNKSDKTFNIIVITAAVIVVLSVALCLFLYFKPQNRPIVVTPAINVSDDFVSQVSPIEDKVYVSGESVKVSVGAKSGATAYAMILGQKIPLTAGVPDSSGYCVLSGYISLPQAQSYTQELGNIAFFITYEGITQIAYGGKVTINANNSQGGESTSSTAPSSQQPQSPQSSQVVVLPGSDSSQVTFPSGGDAKMLVVTGPVTEIKDLGNHELVYNPTYGNLIAGMSDYVVEKITDTDEDGNFVPAYRLMSGRGVVENDRIRIVDAPSEMTYNTMTLSQTSDSGSPKIVIGETNKVPYKCRYIGQGFQSGHDGLKFNVSSFTATAIDFIFDYTVSYSGSLSAFSDEIVSSVTVSTNPDDKTLILHCNLKRPGKFFGYILENDQNGNLVLSFRQPVKSISNLTVLIDPGHGGTPGAVDQSKKYRECDQTLAISRYFASYLCSAGATVYMTRNDDSEVSLETRRLMSQQIKPDLTISIHLDGAEDKSKNGSSTFYYKPFSQPLASCINNRIAAVYASSVYPDNPTLLKSANGGARYYPFYVTRTDVCPAVLCEVGFITHEVECRYLFDPAYQQTFAKAIFDGVCDFVAQQ